jgi:hypothetical protein
MVREEIEEGLKRGEIGKDISSYPSLGELIVFPSY